MSLFRKKPKKRPYKYWVSAKPSWRIKGPALSRPIGIDTFIIFIVIGITSLVCARMIYQTYASGGFPEIVETANAEVGNTNYSKYNGHPGLWCADFVSWVYKQSGHPFTSGTGGWQISSTIGIQNWFKSNGNWYARGSGDTPQPGDFVRFNWNGSASSTSNNHSGIVWYVSGSTMYTIEGNSSGKVSKGNKYNYKTNTDVIGWGRLKGATNSKRTTVMVRGVDGTLAYKHFKDNKWSTWNHFSSVTEGGPAVSTWGPGRLDVFARNSSNNLIHRSYEIDRGWNGWNNLGGNLTSDPAAVSWGLGRIDVFARGGADGKSLIHQWFTTSGGWSGWENLGGNLTSAPAVASWGKARLDVFVRGAAGDLAHKAYDYGWQPWNHLGGNLTTGPAAVSWGPGRIDVFVGGVNREIAHKAFSNGWQEWKHLGGYAKTDPAVSSRAPGTLDLFVVGSTDDVAYKFYKNGSWTTWAHHDSNPTSSPDAVAW